MSLDEEGSRGRRGYYEHVGSGYRASRNTCHTEATDIGKLLSERFTKAQYQYALHIVKEAKVVTYVSLPYEST